MSMKDQGGKGEIPLEVLWSPSPLALGKRESDASIGTTKGT